jgi:Domain of unknown function (DUF1992)
MPDIDEQIQKAQQNGEFDQLRGTGKPFTHLDSDPLRHLLDAQGFTPHWLEGDHEIQRKIELAEQAVKRTYEWVMELWSSGSADRHFAQEEWRRALQIFNERITGINIQIKSFNLELPEAVRHLQRFPIKREEVFKRLGLKNQLA